MTDTVSKRARREGEWLQQLSPKGNRLEQQAGGGGGAHGMQESGGGHEREGGHVKGGRVQQSPSKCGEG